MDGLQPAIDIGGNNNGGWGNWGGALIGGAIGAANALGQSRTEAVILTTGYQGQLAAKDNTFEIVSSQKDCCCAAQRLIE